jgi:hypothetical protein
MPGRLRRQKLTLVFNYLQPYHPVLASSRSGWEAAEHPALLEAGLDEMKLAG